jgi:conjugal transfer pilus assembly protein TraL
MRDVRIPRYIDSAPHIFFWEIDEFLILVSVFGLGIFFGGMYTLLGVIGGFVAVNLFKRYKSGGLPGQLNHLCHWKNIMNINFAFPRSGKRKIFK